MPRLDTGRLALGKRPQPETGCAFGPVTTRKIGRFLAFGDDRETRRVRYPHRCRSGCLHKRRVKGKQVEYLRGPATVAGELFFRPFKVTRVFKTRGRLKEE